MADFRRQNSLSPADALFLYFEREGQPVNVAAICIFEGVISLELCTQFIESKLSLLPRYVERVVAPPYDIDLPAWEYDPHFNLRNHVREVTLKRSTETELKTLAGAILSSNMDRNRPLWDFTLVKGLQGNRTAVIVRLHHCLADGISGVKILNVLLDPSPAAPPVTPPAAQPASPQRQSEKSLLDSIISSSISAVQRVLAAESELLGLAKAVVDGAENQLAAADTAAPSVLPSNASLAALDKAFPAISKLKRLLPELAMATRLPFNIVCRGPQKFRWAEIPLAGIKAVKQACEATVNDVVLTVVTSAVRRYAQLHGVRLRGRMLRIVVPVNLRNGDSSELGNQITFLPVNIPLDIDESRELLGAVRDAVIRSRTAQTAELIGLLGTVVATIPTPVQALIGPLVSQLPLSLCNLICTNVPGPQIPLYLLGHKLLASYPYVPIGGEMGMNCAVLTYDGTAFFGFTGDAHAIPDLERMEKLLVSSFADLSRAAGVRVKRTRRPRTKPVAAPQPISIHQEAGQPTPSKEPAKENVRQKATQEEHLPLRA